MSRALLIVLLLAPVASAQPKGSSPTKKPESSSAADFKPAEVPKLALLVSVGGKLNGPALPGAQRLVEDAFLECVLAKGYTVAARSDVDSVLREKKFQDSGATEELAASVGKVLNVPAVLLVRVTDLSINAQNQTARAVIGARLISVENGSILWTGNHSNTGPTAGRSGAGATLLVTATALAEVFPTKPQAAQPKPRPIDSKAFPKLAVVTVGEPGRRLAPGGGKRDSVQSDRDRQVEDVFVQVLLTKGYKLVSRTDLEALMKEQAFQRSGLTEDNAVAAGKLLNVPAVLLVGVTDSATEPLPGRGKGGTVGRAAVGARLVDVASGEVRWSHAEYQAQAFADKDGADDLLSGVAKRVAQFLPPEPDSARGLLDRAGQLETMGQFSAAKRSYGQVVDLFANTTEGKRAAAKLKSLNN